MLLAAERVGLAGLWAGCSPEPQPLSEKRCSDHTLTQRSQPLKIKYVVTYQVSCAAVRAFVRLFFGGGLARAVSDASFPRNM